MHIPSIRYNLCFFIILFFTGIGFAEQETASGVELQSLQKQVAELQKAMKDANDRHSAEITLLKEQIELLKQNQAAAAKTLNQQTVSVQPVQPQPGAAVAGYETNPLGRIAQSFNPDISVIGDVLFHAGKNDENTKQNQFEFREMELAFGSAVDPYGRADFFLGIEKEDGEWHTHLEEGYFTFNTLPYDLKARAGKFYSAFGKANQMHTHSMPWVDKPLLIQNFFGEEGMSEAGAELSWLVPNPWNNYIELILQLQNNANEASFAGDQSNDLMYVAHLKNFFEIDTDSTIELGGSFATGSNADTTAGHKTYLEGLDLTYKWQPPQQGLYKSLTWMNEILFSQKQQGIGDTVHSYGLYSSLEYQFDRRWSTFGRYDYSQFPDDNDSHEKSFSTGLTFRQSEYCFWRFQFKHIDPDGISAADESRNELFIQLNFGIGPHRAHQY
jgi:cell division protein FtsB